VPDAPAGRPAFGDLLSRGQAALAELAAAGEKLAGELATRQAELNQAVARQRQLEQELELLRAAQQAWAAQKRDLESAGEALQAELAGLHEEREQLKDLHAQVTGQAGKLAADWNARRQALTADNQRLTAELGEHRRTLLQAQEREKQWKAQVWKLQDDLRALRSAGGRVTLNGDQSHHLLSKLNAISGFAQVLLDEAGNRATGAERQEFLENIRDSGSDLVEMVNRLMGHATAELAEGAEVEAPLPAPAADAPAVLVAAADPALCERLQSFLNRAGYRAEFAADGDAALKAAIQLQPLAIVVDTELPPKGAQALVADLLHEARTRDLPVVLAAKNEEEQLGLSLGQYDFLRKPITRQQVLQVMAKYDLLAERRRASKMPTSVLVIDDDPKNTRLVQAMLKPYNIEVLLAHDGAAGIKLARARRPDLIILDLMMPDVDGFEVVTALRAESATAQTPILIYTAKNITGADRQRLQGNIQSIIRKGDFSKEQFLELVYRRGERRQARPAADVAA
jgi:CheY-like chemotaxis protein